MIKRCTKKHSRRHQIKSRRKSLKRRSVKRSVKRSVRRSRRRSIRSRRKSLKRRSVKRSVRKSKKRSKRKILIRRDGAKEYELSQIKNKEKNIRDKSILINKFLYENVGTPTYFRNFSKEDIEHFATLWENAFNNHKTLDDDLFDKLYRHKIGLKEIEAEEELFPTEYPSPRAEVFFEGDKVYIKGCTDDNIYIMNKLNMDDSANLTSYPYIPFYSVNLTNIPLERLAKSSIIEKGFLGLGGKTSFGL
jgi:hypothetical protein